MRVVTFLCLSCVALGCDGTTPGPSCPDLVVAPLAFGQNPTVENRLGAACRLEPGPVEGELSSNCVDVESTCLTDSFGFRNGACVTIDQCSVQPQGGCPPGGVCHRVDDHNWCFQGCADDLDCRYAEGYRCQGGSCFPACRADEDCRQLPGVRLACDVGTGRCLPDAGCPATPCRADERCVGVGTAGGGRCLKACDLMTQDCDGKDSCVIAPGGAAVCARTGFLALGAACSEWNACERGSLCAGGSCKPICDDRDACACGTDQAQPR